MVLDMNNNYYDDKFRIRTQKMNVKSNLGSGILLTLLFKKVWTVITLNRF